MPARWPATIWAGARLPGSRGPRRREPSTKSASPRSIGASTAGIISGRSLPSPSMKRMVLAPGEMAAMPDSSARP